MRPSPSSNSGPTLAGRYHGRYAPTRIWRAMKFKMLLRKRGGVRARAAGAESGAGISNQPPAGAAESPRYNIVPQTRSKNPSTKRLSESAA